MRKKLFTLLSLLALIGVLAWAEETGTSEDTTTYVAKVGDTQYETLQDAIDAATGDNPTVSLLSNVTLDKTVTINKSLTLDLVSFNIEAVDTRALHITGGNVVIQRSGTTKGYIIAKPAAENSTFDENSSVIRVGDNSGEQRNVSLTIEKNVRVNTDYCYGITVFGNKTKETVTINGTVTTAGKNAAISGNGSSGYGGTTITINGTVYATGSKVEEVPYSIYHPQDGTLNINGTVGSTSLSKSGAIEAKSGIININENAKVYAAKNAITTHTGNTNGYSTTGYAIAVINNNSYAGGTKVNINNKKNLIQGELAILTDPEKGFDDASKNGSIVIESGKFTKPVNQDYIKEGKTYAPSKNKYYYVCEESDLLAKIGDTYKYTVFSEAFPEASEGETLQLLKDVAYTSTLTIGSANNGMTLDLNGYKLSYAASKVKSGFITVNHGASFTVMDSSEGQNGEINSGEKANAAIIVGNSTTATEPAKLTVNGGKLTGLYYAISGNGTCHNTEITINGGTLTATKDQSNLGIYHPQDGILTINGGQIEGYNSAIELRAGTLNISGGSFKSTATEYSTAANGSGTTTSGAAIAIAQHTTLKDINVSISGGTFEGYNGICVVNPQNNTLGNVTLAITGATVKATDKAIISDYGTTNIYGGTFSSDPNKFCAEGYSATKNDGANYTVEKIKSVEISTPELSGSTVKIESSEGSEGSTAPTQEQANSAVSQVVTSNSAVTDFDTTPASESLSMTDAAASETKETVHIGGEDVNVAGKTIVQLVQMAAAKTEGVSEDSKNNIVASDINQIVKIDFKQASVKSEGGNAVVDKISFNIKPTAIVMVDDKKVELPVPNALIANPITFRLPVDNNTQMQFVRLYHKADGSETEEDLGLYEIRTDENGNKYIEVSAKNFSEYGYTLSETSGNIDVYLGTATKETKAVGDWETILEATPNAIAVVSSELATWAGRTKNVLVKYTAGSQDVYECPHFELTDLKEFYTPVEFKAITGSYNRQPNAADVSTIEYNSVCLPFAFSASELSETAKILTFAYYDNANTAYFNRVDNISAGNPCIIQETGTSWNKINLAGKTIVASPNMDGNMRGTFVTTSAYGKDSEGKTEYYSVGADNKFSPLADVLKPFRSCLWLHNDGSIGQGSASAKAIRIIEDGEATGIESLESSDIESREIFTINGMKVSGNAKNLPRGMYIMNGKKFIVR